MRMKLQAMSLAAVALILAAPTPIAAQKAWTLLGERMVTDRADHDQIAVTSSEGTFRQIKLAVRRHAVDFRRVVVHFGNGADQTIDMKQTIRAGSETRAIDLEGDNRNIRSVEFWYDANSRGRQAVVRLLGKH